MSAHPAVCRCGHLSDAHEHLRRGTDCAMCGPGQCQKFSPAARPSLAARLATLVHRSRPNGVVVAHPRLQTSRHQPPGSPATEHQDDAQQA